MDASLGHSESTADPSARQRILQAAFKVFSEKGFEGASTLMIATQAKVSKRDLYSNFASKHEMLVACIEGRAASMDLAAQLPRPTSPVLIMGWPARLQLRIRCMELG